MTNNTDSLAALWQQQAVDKIDVKKIQCDYRSQKWKQRVYICVDLLAPLPVIALLYMTEDKLSDIAFWSCVLVLAITIPFVLYFIWLRRHAAFNRAVDTHSYVNVLNRQMANNVKIAFYTKHSSWLASLYLLGVNGYQLFAGDLDSKASFSLAVFYGWMGFGVLLCAICFVWASRREKRFRARCDELAVMTGQIE